MARRGAPQTGEGPWASRPSPSLTHSFSDLQAFFSLFPFVSFCFPPHPPFYFSPFPVWVLPLVLRAASWLHVQESLLLAVHGRWGTLWGARDQTLAGSVQGKHLPFCPIALGRSPPFFAFFGLCRPYLMVPATVSRSLFRSFCQPCPGDHGGFPVLPTDRTPSSFPPAQRSCWR